MFQINDRAYPGGRPKKGSVYVVNGVVEKCGILGLFLVGIPSLDSDGIDRGWKAIRFRKLSGIQAENRRKAKAEPWNDPLPSGNPLKKLVN